MEESDIIGRFAAIIETWQRLRTRPEEAVFVLQHFPSPGQDQLLTTPGDTGVYAKESGTTEVFAGENSLLLDKATGVGRLGTKNILTLQSTEVRVSADRLVVNGSEVNPELLRLPASPQDPNQLVAPGPLFFGPDIMLVAGAPVSERGQYNIMLSQLLGLTSLMTRPVPIPALTDVDTALARTNKYFQDPS